MRTSTRTTTEPPFSTDPGQHEVLGRALALGFRHHVHATGDLDALRVLTHLIWVSEGLGVQIGVIANYHLLQDLMRGAPKAPEVVRRWCAVRECREVARLHRELSRVLPWVADIFCGDLDLYLSKKLPPLAVDVEALAREQRRLLDERLDQITEMCRDPRVEFKSPEDVIVAYTADVLRLAGHELTLKNAARADAETAVAGAGRRLNAGIRHRVSDSVPKHWTVAAEWEKIPLGDLFKDWRSEIETSLKAIAHTHGTRGQTHPFDLEIAAENADGRLTWDDCRRRLALSGARGAAQISGVSGVGGALAGGSVKGGAIAKAGITWAGLLKVGLSLAAVSAAGGAAAAAAGLSGWALARLSKAKAVDRFCRFVERDLQRLNARILEAFEAEFIAFMRQRTHEQNLQEQHLLAVLRGEALDQLCAELTERVDLAERVSTSADA